MSKALPYCDCEELNRLRTVVKKYQYEFKFLQTEVNKEENCIHCDHAVVWSQIPFTNEEDLHKRRRGRARVISRDVIKGLVNQRAEPSMSADEIEEELGALLDLFDERRGA